MTRYSNTALWVAQSNLGDSADLNRLHRACSRSGAAWLSVPAVPFSDELPAIPEGRPTIFYGATNFVRVAHKAARWRPCAYFDESRFCFRAYRDNWGEYLLNADAELVTIEQLALRELPADRLYFVRPNRDDKEFAGEVLEFGDLAAWFGRISHGEYTVSPQCEVVFTEPVGIKAEWRLFCVDGRVISGSRYRTRHRLDVSSEVPTEVRAFGEMLLRRWSPAPVIVLDIGQSESNLYAIEANCFNSAGFYAADVDAIVYAVTKYALATFNSTQEQSQ